jgi:hypothetical protein
MQQEVPPEFVKALPGLLGSFVALWWLPGTRMQRVASFVGGAGMSYYGSDYVAIITGTHNGFAAWLLGMFGMAVAHMVYKMLSEFNLAGRIDKILAKWGL